MSQKLSVLLIWNGTDFELTNQKDFRDERQTVVLIDENNQQIIARISPHEPGLEQRIIQRRIHSLAKAGYQYSSNLRINTNSFTLKEISGDFKLSDYQTSKYAGGESRTTSVRPHIEIPATSSESFSSPIPNQSFVQEPPPPPFTNPTSSMSNDDLLALGGKIDEFLNKGMRVFVESSKKTGCKYRISCLGSNEVVEL